MITRRTGPVSVEVQTPQGVLRKHHDQVFQRPASSEDCQTPQASASVESSACAPQAQDIEPQIAVPSPKPATARCAPSPSAAPRRNPTRAARGRPPPKLDL